MRKTRGITDRNGIHLPTPHPANNSGSCTALLAPRVVLGASPTDLRGSNPPEKGAPAIAGPSSDHGLTGYEYALVLAMGRINTRRAFVGFLDVWNEYTGWRAAGWKINRRFFGAPVTNSHRRRYDQRTDIQRPCS